MNSTETKTELPHKTFDCDCPCDICDPSTGKHCGKPPCDITAETIELDTLRTRLEAVEKANGELVKDKERLDWLSQNATSVVAYLNGKKLLDSFEYHFNHRIAIDAAMKAAAEAMKG